MEREFELTQKPRKTPVRPAPRLPCPKVMGAPAGSSGMPLFLQRARKTGASPAPAAETTGVVGEAGFGLATPGLIVEDDAARITPGQMTKREFLSQLRTAVCSTAEEALSGTIWSALGCPWIDHWFDYYGSQDSQHIERVIRRYAPETAGVVAAREYVPLICARVRRSITAWSTTGEIAAIPEGPSAAALLPGLTGGRGDFFSRLGGLLFKARGQGGARDTANPQAIQGRLGAGRPLDGGVRSHVEAAYGHDLSQVRVHTDAQAGELSEKLAARAFTVGRDIAFGPGEYRPGTPIGDALIAHELAHVIQQSGAGAAGGLEAEPPVLEEEADVSAVGAVASIWGGARGALAEVGRTMLPRLRSGLQLQRCRGDSKPRNLVIEHMSGRRFEVPGVSATEREFGATGIPSSLLTPAAPLAGQPITGGFESPLALEIAFGTRVDTSAAKEVNALVASAGSRIDARLVPALTLVAQDRYILTALKSLLDRDKGRLVASDDDRGHYDGASPPTITVGIAGGPLDTRTTLVHELLHYVFDKSDSILAEAKDTGGADHPAIEALEARFLIIDLIRSGQSPLHSKIESQFGRFLQSGDLFPEMQKAITENNGSRLLEIVDDPGFVTTVVSSGLLPTASGLALPPSPDRYRYTAEQFRDLAFLWAQNAVIVRRAMREAVAVAGKKGITLKDVFATSEWKSAMSAFLSAFVTELRKKPTGGVVSLEKRI